MMKMLCAARCASSSSSASGLSLRCGGYGAGGSGGHLGRRYGGCLPTTRKVQDEPSDMGARRFWKGATGVLGHYVHDLLDSVHDVSSCGV